MRSTGGKKETCIRQTLTLWSSWRRGLPGGTRWVCLRLVRALCISVTQQHVCAIFASVHIIWRCHQLACCSLHLLTAVLPATTTTSGCDFGSWEVHQTLQQYRAIIKVSLATK